MHEAHLALVRVPRVAHAREEQLIRRRLDHLRARHEVLPHRLHDAAVQQLAVLVQHELVCKAVQLLERQLRRLLRVDLANGVLQLQPYLHRTRLTQGLLLLKGLQHELGKRHGGVCLSWCAQPPAQACYGNRQPGKSFNSPPRDWKEHTG